MNYGLLNLRGPGYTTIKVQEVQTAMYKIFGIAAIRSAIKYVWKAYGYRVFSEKHLAGTRRTGAPRPAT